jgi:D-alanine-D-alanine ligase
MENYDTNWWQEIFDETYLITDARSVCCPETTATEVDMIQASLDLHSDDRILDLCGGQGRHAIELNRRGYQRVTVVDYSEVLLRVGTRDARRLGGVVSFCRADASEVGLADRSFDVVLIMGNSFGYFEEDLKNQKILFEVCRLLSPGGKVLLDLINRDYARRKFNPTSWHEADEDVVVCRQRKLVDEGVLVREIVLSKSRGLIRDMNYFARLFGQREIKALLSGSGFVQINSAGSMVSQPKEDDYGLLSNRMLITAQKPTN